jgi:hypothetical protein
MAELSVGMGVAAVSVRVEGRADAGVGKASDVGRRTAAGAAGNGAVERLGEAADGERSGAGKGN